MPVSSDVQGETYVGLRLGSYMAFTHSEFPVTVSSTCADQPEDRIKLTSLVPLSNVTSYQRGSRVLH